ncbi:MAG: hypothetical protein K2K72_04760 [Duncaniella sp.]|nr:hypothetical protein [Duncaniella sp.]
MVAFAYIVPVLACLLLHFEFDYNGGWTAYLWITLTGEVTAGGLHLLFYRLHTSRTEYLGSLVTDINHEDSWIELVEVRETKTDSKGQSYTVTRIEERYHKEKYYFHTSRGTCIDTDCGFYSYVRDLWGLPRICLSWSSSRIKGGVRHGSRYRMADFDEPEQENPDNWVPVTERHSYTNKIQASNSIFKFEKIDKTQAAEIGLIDYPAISVHDASCVLSADVSVSQSVDGLFRKFNARYAPEFQMRLYILLFDAERGVSISEMQRAYWQGGNKNEFVVCVGMRNSSEIVWARAFSWADEQTKEVEAAQWLMDHPSVDWQEFHDWLRWHLNDWKRKEFKDFDYINITLPLWQLLCIIAGTIAENTLALYLAIH